MAIVWTQIVPPLQSIPGVKRTSFPIVPFGDRRDVFARGKAAATAFAGFAQGANLSALNHWINVRLKELDPKVEEMLAPGSRQGVLAVVKASVFRPPAGMETWSFQSAFLWGQAAGESGPVIQKYLMTPRLDMSAPKGTSTSPRYYWGTRS